MVSLKKLEERERGLVFSYFLDSIIINPHLKIGLTICNHDPSLFFAHSCCCFFSLPFGPQVVISMKTGGWAGHAQQLHPPKKTHRIALWGKELKNRVINAENSAHFGGRNQYFLSARRKTSFIWSDKFKYWTFLYSQQLNKQSLAILNLKIKKSSWGSGHSSRDPVQLCLVFVCPAKREGKQRPKFLVRIPL